MNDSLIILEFYFNKRRYLKKKYRVRNPSPAKCRKMYVKLLTEKKVLLGLSYKQFLSD